MVDCLVCGKVIWRESKLFREVCEKRQCNKTWEDPIFHQNRKIINNIELILSRLGDINKTINDINKRITFIEDKLH
jgi:hypothetical protein